jgi:hypothetical protein
MSRAPRSTSRWRTKRSRSSIKPCADTSGSATRPRPDPPPCDSLPPRWPLGRN